MMNWRLCLAAALLASVPFAASADPVPSSVTAMIGAAVDSDDPAILASTMRLAKKTNPRSVSEIDAMVAKLQAVAKRRHRAELLRRGFFEGWNGQGEFGAANANGNTRSTGISLGLALNKEGIKWRHSLNATIDYQRTNGVEDKGRYFAGWESDYKITNRLYTLGLLSWESDRFSGFDSRLSESLGMGYSLIQRPRTTLSLEAGPALRQTEYIARGSRNNFAVRAAVTYKWTMLSNLVFSEKASYYGESRDSTFTSDTAFTATLIGALSARASFHAQYESNPPFALESTDTTTRLTLVYAF